MRRLGYLLVPRVLRTSNPTPRCPMWLMGLLGLLVSSVSGSTAEQLTAPKVAQELTGPSADSVLEVVYEPQGDQLSVLARHSMLDKVLQEIARAAHLGIDSKKEELLQQQVSVEMKGLPLEQALRQLLREFNSAFLYASPTATHDKPPAPRLVKVILLSKKEKAVPSETPATSQAPATVRTASADANGEKARTVETLLASLEGPANFEDKDFPPFRRAVDALKALAPERMVDPLVNLMLQNSNPPIRVYAASTLGEVADQRAIEPLVWTFGNDEYPLARQVAMYSLVSIGTEGALEPVFKAFKEGDAALQQAIAVILAGKGNEKARAGLARIIAEGRVSEDVIKAWQLAQPQ